MNEDYIIFCLRGWLDTDWRQKDKCLDWLYFNGLKINERSFRLFVANYDKGYCEGKHDSYICHDNSKGYFLTCDKEEIKKSIADDRSRAITLLRRVYGVEKRIAEDTQISFMPNDELFNAYDVVLKSEVNDG